MFQIADLAGMLPGIALRNGGTSIRGPIVYQQQFPRTVCLAEDALDRLVQEALCIKEDDNNRDYRWRSHLTIARVAPGAPPSVRPGARVEVDLCKLCARPSHTYRPHRPQHLMVH